MATLFFRPIRHGQVFRALREDTSGAVDNVASWSVRDFLSGASDLRKSGIQTGLSRHGARSNPCKAFRAKLASKNGRGTQFRSPKDGRGTGFRSQKGGTGFKSQKGGTGFKLPFVQPKQDDEWEDEWAEESEEEEEPEKKPEPRAKAAPMFDTANFKFPPAYQVTAFVAFTIAAYVVQHVTGEILSTILQAVDSVPYLAQLESLIGVLAVSQFVSKFLIADTGKARLEDVLDGLQERVAGKDLGRVSGPQMLEVQLRSLLDEQAPPTETDGNRVEDEEAVLLKQALVTSLMSFILERETKARRINAVLRNDVEEERARVIKMKQAVALYAEKEAASLSELKRLTNSTQALKKERDAAVASMSSLNARLESTTDQLENMSSKRTGLESLNTELRDRVSTIMSENKQLSGQVSTLDEAREKAISELRAVKAIADASLMDNKGLQDRVQALAKERDQLQAALSVARKKLRDAEQELAALRKQIGYGGGQQRKGGLAEASSGALAFMRETLEKNLQNHQSEVGGLEANLQTLEAENAALVERLKNVEALERSLQAVTEEKDFLAERLQKAESLGRNLGAVTAEKEALSAQLKSASGQNVAGGDLMAQIEQLQKSLDEAERERSVAKERIATLESAQEPMLHAIDELETELENAVQKLAVQVVEHRDDMAARMAAYERELESRSFQIERLTVNLTDVQRQKRDAEEAVQAAQARLSQFDQNQTEEVQGLRAELESLRAAGEEAQEMIVRLETQLRDGGNGREAPAQMLANVHRNREASERQLAEAQSSMEVFGREERIAALRAEVEAWQVAEGEAEDLVNQLEDQIESGGDVKTALAAYEQSLEAKQEEIEFLETQLANNAAEYNRVMKEKEGLQAELETRLRGAEQERNDAIELLQDGRDRLAEMKDLAGVLVTQLESRVHALTHAEEQSQTAIALLEERLAGLQAERGTYSAAETESRLQVQETRIEELSRRLEGVKEEKAEIEKALADAEGNLQRAAEETDEEKEALAAEIEKLSGAESKSRDVIAQLEGRLSAMVGEVAEKRKEAASAEETLAEAVGTLEQELRSLIEQRAGLADNLEQTKAELAKQEADFAKQLETLRERLAVLEESESGAQAKVSQLEEAVKEADKERAALVADADEARARAEELEREKASLLASREAELVAARRERDAIREKFRAAERQLAAAHEGSKAQQRQVAKLEGRVAELTSSNEEAQARIDELGSTLEKLTEGQDEEVRSAVSKQLEDSRRLKEGLDQELVALQGRLAETESAGKTSVGELQAELEALRAQERRAQQEVETLRAQLTAVTSAADERLQSVTAQYSSGLSDKEHEVENLLRGLRSLQQEKAGASAELEDVRRQVEQLEVARDRDVKALQMRVIQLEEDGHEGGAALESARARLAELNGELENSREGVQARNYIELTSLKAEKQQLASSQASMQFQLAQLAQEREQQQALVASLEIRLANTETDQQASLELISKLRSDIEAAERAAVDAEEMKRQLAELQTQLQESAAKAAAPPSERPRRSPPSKPMRRATSDAPFGEHVDDIAPDLKAHLVAYNYEVREQFVDLRKTTKQQSEGVQKLIEALVEQGATEAWARAYVIRNLSYERIKLKKQDGK